MCTGKLSSVIVGHCDFLPASKQIGFVLGFVSTGIPNSLESSFDPDTCAPYNVSRGVTLAYGRENSDDRRRLVVAFFTGLGRWRGTCNTHGTDPAGPVRPSLGARPINRVAMLTYRVFASGTKGELDACVWSPGAVHVKQGPAERLDLRPADSGVTLFPHDGRGFCACFGIIVRFGCGPQKGGPPWIEQRHEVRPDGRAHHS